jgi:DNA repair photolyase
MNIIYEPKGRAREYSSLAANLYTGCDHGCLYCYAPAAMRMPRGAYHARVSGRTNVIEKLHSDAAHLEGTSLQVLLSFLGDPYCKANDTLNLTAQALEVFLEHRIPVAVLTKGGKRCLDDIALFERFGSSIKVGASLTFKAEALAREWEPGAAAVNDRIGALEELARHGVPTWVSLEPVIDPEESLALLAQTLPFVGEYKLGKLNHFQEREREIDWVAYLDSAVSILRKVGKPFYVKEDLREAAPRIDLNPDEIDSDAHSARPFGKRTA